MKTGRWVFVILLTAIISLSIMLVGEKLLFELEYRFPPPPGWRSFVSDALLDVNSFPEGWVHNFDSPANLYSDLEINHVYRAWGQENDRSGSAEESIWRAYSKLQAKDFYGKLIKTQVHFRKKPKEFSTGFSRPEEIIYRSKTADKESLVCGWYIEAYCDYFAVYQNYVVYLHIELENDLNGHYSDGLSYQEIEDILVAADLKMNNYLKANRVIP